MPLMLDEIIDLGIAAVAACLRRLQHPSAAFSLSAVVIIFWPFGLLSSLPPPLPSPPQLPTPESEPPESPPLEIFTPGSRWTYTSLGYVQLPVPEPFYLPLPVSEQLPVYERPPEGDDRSETKGTVIGASAGSSDSGSLTQRAAMIRDELLGNDSVASDTEPLSDSSTSKSEGEAESRTTKTMDSSFSDTDLEDRLSCSGIAHSLRHIALAFDEKSRELDSLRSIQQRHDEELAILQDRLKTAEQEHTARTLELQLSNSSREDMEREVDALKQRLEEKDELLFVSDRVLHRLFHMIRVIKTQVDEAESLSPAVRSSEEETQSDKEASAEDSHDGDETNIETPFPTFKSQAEEEIDQIVRDIAERYGKTGLGEEA